MYPTKPRRQLLLAIKKDLELLGKDDNTLVAKQAHLFLKKWSRLKVTDLYSCHDIPSLILTILQFPLQEDPAESSSSAAAATATATGTHTTFGKMYSVTKSFYHGDSLLVSIVNSMAISLALASMFKW